MEGTLDPLAIGILILGIDSATKVLPRFLDCMKPYEATVVCAAATDTYDHIMRDKTKGALDHFRGGSRPSSRLCIVAERTREEAGRK